MEISGLGEISGCWEVEEKKDLSDPVMRDAIILSLLHLALESMQSAVDYSTTETFETTTSLFSDRTPHSKEIGRSTAKKLLGSFATDVLKLADAGDLVPSFQNRRQEIEAQKEFWRPAIHLEFQDLDALLQIGDLVPVDNGAGSAYLLNDENDTTRYVIKPVDEDIYCFNNRKGRMSPFNDHQHRPRYDIPLYRAAQTDACCYEIACLAGIQSVTPKAVMAIIASDIFYDVCQGIEQHMSPYLTESEKKELINLIGRGDCEKLCSIQEFISDSCNLSELLHCLYHSDFTDETIATYFDQTDFENACLFVWLTYDNDAHGSNFRAYEKRVEASGHIVYGIKKIDNGLALPEKNTDYVNVLAWLPNGEKPLSEEIKEKIQGLPTEAILSSFDRFGLSLCKEAFSERVVVLQELIQREGITAEDIDIRLSILSVDDGKEMALSQLTKTELLDLYFHASTERETTS